MREEEEEKEEEEEEEEEEEREEEGEEEEEEEEEEEGEEEEERRRGMRKGGGRGATAHVYIYLHRDYNITHPFTQLDIMAHCTCHTHLWAYRILNAHNTNQCQS